MKCRTTVELIAGPTHELFDVGNGVLPVGSVIESPQAFRLVQQGKAQPADDECRQRLGQPGNRAVDVVEAAAERMGETFENDPKQPQVDLKSTLNRP